MRSADRRRARLLCSGLVGTLAGIGLVVGALSSARAATPPTPTYGTATVDGDASEWNLSSDFYAAMYVAGDPSKAAVANGYLRYDCSTNTLYVLVLQADGTPLLSSPTGNAWAEINGSSTKVYTDTSGNSGTPPEFAWVGRGYSPTDATYAQGYEAAFSLAPGSYTIVAHVEALYNSTASTAGFVGFNTHTTSATVPLDVNCDSSTTTTTTDTTATTTTTTAPSTTTSTTTTTPPTDPTTTTSPPDSTTTTTDSGTTTTTAPSATTTTTTTAPLPPTASPRAVTTTPGAAVTVDELADDTPGTGAIVPSSVTVTTPPGHGSAQVNADGSITYAPADGFSGPDSLAYQVCDTNQLCASATVSITVAPLSTTSTTPTTAGPPAGDPLATAGPTAARSSGPLAFTGSTLATLALGASLIAGGGTLLVVARRRRSTQLG
jgi:hypothetical protein